MQRSFPAAPRTDGEQLTFPSLPLLQDSFQPFLLLLGGFRHAHKPLVLRGVVDLPAVNNGVAAAVVVSWEQTRLKEHGTSKSQSCDSSEPSPLQTGLRRYQTAQRSLKVFVLLVNYAVASSKRCPFEKVTGKCPAREGGTNPTQRRRSPATSADHSTRCFCRVPPE